MKSIIDVVKPADYVITSSDSANPPNVVTWNMVHNGAPTGFDFEKTPDTIVTERSPLEKRSFQDIKRRGIISMTPYFVKDERVTNFIVSLKNESVVVRYPTWGDMTVCKANHGQKNLVTSWSEQGDLPTWTKMHPLILHTQLNELPDVTAAVRSTQSSAVKAFKSGYDLLTELAEGRETLAFFGSVSKTASDSLKRFLSEVEPNDLQKALKGKYTPKKLLQSTEKGLKALGSKWMAYRYAIMPLFYSFQDIKKLVDKRGLLYQTYRQKESFNIVPPVIPDGKLELQLMSFWSGSIDVKSTVKAGYSKEGLQSFISSQVGLNPLATAYELVPLSFVFDWIVNMGDWIVSHTSLDFSEQSAMCTTIREKLTKETMLCIDETRRYEITVGGTNLCLPTQFQAWYDVNRYAFSTLRLETRNNYRRSLFTSADVKLTLNSSMMNWKRYIDAAVLSHQSLKNLIKKAF